MAICKEVVVKMSGRECHVWCGRATTRVSGNDQEADLRGERRSMTDNVVASDQWGQLIFYDEWNTLELKWLPTTREARPSAKWPIAIFSLEASAWMSTMVA